MVNKYAFAVKHNSLRDFFAFGRMDCPKTNSHINVLVSEKPFLLVLSESFGEGLRICLSYIQYFYWEFLLYLVNYIDASIVSIFSAFRCTKRDILLPINLKPFHLTRSLPNGDAV